MGATNPEQAVADIARAMAELGCNYELRQAMGNEGQKRVRDEYLWEKKGDRLDALYASVLENQRSRNTAPVA